jgi:hypothetical protein
MFGLHVECARLLLGNLEPAMAITAGLNQALFSLLLPYLKRSFPKMSPMPHDLSFRDDLWALCHFQV